MTDTMPIGTVKRRSWKKIAGLAPGAGCTGGGGAALAQAGGVKLNTTQVDVQQVQ